MFTFPSGHFPHVLHHWQALFHRWQLHSRSNSCLQWTFVFPVAMASLSHALTTLYHVFTSGQYFRVFSRSLSRKPLLNNSLITQRRTEPLLCSLHCAVWGWGVDARLNKKHFLPFKDISALTGHHLPLLERPWWNWKDLLGLAWCDGDAVCMHVAGVVRFTHIGHTASHSRDKVAVMLLTLAVSLQQMGREEQNSFH